MDGLIRAVKKLNMFPVLSEMNLTNCSRIYSKHSTKLNIGVFASGMKFPNLQYIRIFKLRFCMIFSAIRFSSTKISEAESYVFAVSDPFKIIEIVIRSLVVYVVNNEAFLSFSEKSLGNKDMDTDALPFVFMPKIHIVIASFIHLSWLKNSIGMCVSDCQNPFDLSGIANLVNRLVTHYWFPYFLHKKSPVNSQLVCLSRAYHCRQERKTTISKYIPTDNNSTPSTNGIIPCFA